MIKNLQYKYNKVEEALKSNSLSTLDISGYNIHIS